MTLSADLIAQVRSDVAELTAQPHILLESLIPILKTEDRDEREIAAFRAVRRVLAIRSLGELVSLRGKERDDLLALCTNSDEERSMVTGWITLLSKPDIFRTFSHVLPYSFRPFVPPDLILHQEQLRRIIREPIWPGVPATLEELFVPQRCEISFFRTDAGNTRGRSRRTRIHQKSAKSPRGAPRQIEELLHATRSPIVVEGDPGSGKSSLAAMIGGAFAERWGFVPVLLRASDFSREEIRFADPASDEQSGPLGWVNDLAVLGRPLILVDGLDELHSLLLTRVLRRLSTLLTNLGDESRIVLFGRPSATLTVAELLSPDTRAVTLLPFDASQSRLWAERWREATGRQFDVERLLQSGDDRHKEDAASRDLAELARAPLTLFLLASTELTGKQLPTSKTSRGRTAIFRRVLDRVASSQAKSGNISHREAARAVAVALRLSPPSDTRRSAIRHRAGALLGHEQYVLLDVALSSFPIMVGSDDGVRFVHASMRDQLVAEYLAVRVTWLLDAVGKKDSHPAPQERGLVAGWVETFGRLPIDDALLSPLRHMVPDWSAYQRDSAGKVARTAALRNLLTIVYKWLIDDRAAEIVLSVARAQESQPRRVAAVALYNAFVLAHCATREEFEAAWFKPEVVVPGSFATAWHIIAAEIDLADRTREIVIRATSLRGMHSSSLDRLLIPPFQLVAADLSDADLRGARVKNAYLPNVCLNNASLSLAHLQ